MNRETVSHDDGLIFEFTPDLDGAFTASSGDSLTVETILSLVGGLEISQVVDPLVTARNAIPNEYLSEPF